MLFVIVLVLATGVACFAAFKLGQRSDMWPLLLSPLLVLAAWRLLTLKIPQGEGAAIGVVVVDFSIWYIGAVCALLALILPGTSFYMRRSAAVAGVLVLAVGALITLGYRLATPKPVASSPHSETPKDVAAPRASYLEGYAWAVDSGIDTEALCVNGSAAFIDGCKHAARRQQRPR